MMKGSWQQSVKTLYNACIITMENDHRVIENGYLIIENDKIKAIGHGQPEPMINPINLQGKIVMPGLINTHTHLAMTLYRGLADDLPLHDWLQKHIWPAEAKYTCPQNIAIGANLGLCEMIRTGTTTFCDMYFFTETTAECIKKAGLRAVLGEGIVDFPTNSYHHVDQALNKAEDFITHWNHDSNIHPAVVLHSPYACSNNTLKRALELAQKHQVVLNIHISETQQEVEESVKQHQLTPVGYLEKLGFFDHSVCAAHMVWPQPAEIDILAKHGVSIAHCPTSNLKLASGIAPIPTMMEKGINISLGTDGCASNNNLNLFREIHLAALLHKGNNLDPRIISAQQAIEMATINGAKALGLSDITGSLKPGKQADLLVIDTQNSFMTPLYEVFSALVYSIESQCVETVLVNGKPLMIEHQLTTLNEVECIGAMNRFKENCKLH